MDMEDLESPNAFVVFLIRPSSDKWYNVAATCLSPFTGACMFVTFFLVLNAASKKSLCTS